MQEAALLLFVVVHNVKNAKQIGEVRRKSLLVEIFISGRARIFLYSIDFQKKIAVGELGVPQKPLNFTMNSNLSAVRGIHFRKHT